MAGISDEAFARYVRQAGMAGHDQIEEAQSWQSERAASGALVSLAEALIHVGAITAKQREIVEQRVQAQQAGGIKQLGAFKLLRKVGEGGMGSVYLAEDLNAGRKVAVKVLHKKYAKEREFLTRFRREAQATGKLNHVNIVGAYTIGEDAGVHYYAMEYCDGETLDRVLKQHSIIQWDLAVGIAIQVSRGLKHAHEHNIIHRDIKPANIFICKPLGTPEDVKVETFAEGFVAKILDLGLSKNLGDSQSSFYTQTGVALGTPHYISPEQAKGEKTIDGRTDIYSLGATLYRLVTGLTPFSGSTAAIVMMKHLNEQLTNPQDINEELPDAVAHVIVRMMAKEPNDRYRDCNELLDDLEIVLDGRMPSSPAVAESKSSVAMRLRTPRAKGTAPPPRRSAGVALPGGVRRQEPVAAAPAAPQPHGTRRHEQVGTARAGTNRHEPVGAVRVGTNRHEPVAQARAGTAQQPPVRQPTDAHRRQPRTAQQTRQLQMAVGLVSCGAVILLYGLFSVFSGGGSQEEKPVVPKERTEDFSVTDSTSARANSVKRPEATPDPAQTAAATDNARERYAQGLLSDLTAKEKAGTISATDLRSGLEDLAQRHAMTKAAKTAAERLKAMATPSTPAAATPRVSPPIAETTTAPTSPIDDPERWKNAIDLLALVDPLRDSGRGAWRLVDGTLRKEQADGFCGFPYVPPDEYDFRIVFTRVSGPGDVKQNLAKAQRYIGWNMDAFRKGIYGLARINGQWSETSAANKVGAPLQNGRKYQSTVSVRNDGVAAYLDGQLILARKTDFTEFGGPITDLRLGVGGYDCAVVFESAQVLEVTGRGTFTRPDDPAAKAAIAKRDGQPAPAIAVQPETPPAATAQVPATVAVPTQPPALKPGLWASYWSLDSKGQLSKFVLGRQESRLVWNLKGESPDTRVPKDNFGVRYRGLLRLEQDGTYDFEALADDYVVLAIDGHIVVQASMTAVQCTRTLEKGDHEITAQYREKTGNAALSLRWQLKGAFDWQEIPVTALWYDPEKIQEYQQRVLTDDAALAPAFILEAQSLHELKGHSDAVTSAAFSPDGRAVATCSSDRTVRLWNVATGQEMRMLSRHGAGVESVAFSPNGRGLASASWDRTLRLWDLASGEQIRYIRLSTGSRTVAFSPDSRWVLTAADDKQARLWDATTGQEVKTFVSHTAGVMCATFSPDGKRIATASRDKTVKVWDVSNGRVLATATGHSEEVLCVAFSPDGTKVVSGSKDKTARIWEAATGKERLQLKGHNAEVRCAAFSPDGAWVATGSFDKTTRLWDAETGRQLCELPGHVDHVRSVAISADGTRVITGSKDKTARLWVITRKDQ